MKQFKKILFVNEQSSASNSAATRAVELTKSSKAKLTLCDANKELSRTMPKLKKTLEKIHKDQIIAQFEENDLAETAAKIKLLTGTPFIEIIKEVKRGKHDLVIKLAEKTSSLFGGLFSETDLNLMRKCPCPVWIVKPSRQKTYKRIVAAVDPDPGIESHAKLNKDILDLAISLAKTENCELHIVHAWQVEGENLLRSHRTALSPVEVDALIKGVKDSHIGYMKDMLANYDLSGVDFKTHLLKGLPGIEIPKFVKKNAADVIVMGTLARTGIEGFFIGNTAEKILNNVDCSVLTVKPEGFVSPVGG